MRFAAVIEERPGPRRAGIWLGFLLPPEAIARLGATRGDRRPRRRVPVRGSVESAPFRSSVYKLEDGSWGFITSLELRRKAGVSFGDEVIVEMAEDLDERALEPPPDLAAALAASPELAGRWDYEPWSHKRELVAYLDDAKKPATRANRVAKVVGLLAISGTTGDPA